MNIFQGRRSAAIEPARRPIFVYQTPAKHERLKLIWGVSCCTAEPELVLFCFSSWSHLRLLIVIANLDRISADRFQVPSVSRLGHPFHDPMTAQLRYRFDDLDQLMRFMV
jgi:hypothetical protein